MPWVASSQEEILSSSPSQRQCERTAFAFYCAVREQLPVWLLEDMRTMEVFCWEDGHPRAFSHSEALLYALVHDHQDYARYLLHTHAASALRAPRCSFCCCRSSGAPHLNVAVRYDRVRILGMIVEALQGGAAERVTRDYINSCGGCAHVADSGKAAAELAVELSRPDCLLLLLAHGAQPHGVDAALQRVEAARAPEERQDALRCLDFLLLFLPKPEALRLLSSDSGRWQELLGTEVFNWLCGLAPPSLLLQSLRSLAQEVPSQLSHLPNFLQLQSWQKPLSPWRHT
ncbi:ankyrin repeat domain-containing protein 9-like [Synchiropus splendidus]|uniref:ankyrin repeat domain-containing protein 9-like n=1 Tax=Synchiropus splendidus TaxID=270530 RepID=UPI00237D64E5|nr:ankyrin repeat domain-containing protein 9-like [Synchiropus splendidus]